MRCFWGMGSGVGKGDHPQLFPAGKGVGPGSTVHRQAPTRPGAMPMRAKETLPGFLLLLLLASPACSQSSEVARWKGDLISGGCFWENVEQSRRPKLTSYLL